VKRWGSIMRRRVASPENLVRRMALLESMAPCNTYALSTYSRCEFRCVYCITGVQGSSVPRYGPDVVAPRLREELATLAPDQTITVGALCDAYPPIEVHYRVTRRALEELISHERVFRIVTKGTTVLRDADLLAGRAGTAVVVSLCSVHEEPLRRVDPRAPGAAERLSLVHRLADADVRVSISAAPWIPGISDARALLDRVDERIHIEFAPLNVLDPHVVSTPFGRRFSQRAVNEAYVREYESLADRPNTRWHLPIAVGNAQAATHPMACLPRQPAHSG
jgi:DNA repair photolyase